MKIGRDQVETILYKSVCGFPAELFFCKNMSNNTKAVYSVCKMEDKNHHKTINFDQIKKPTHTSVENYNIFDMT